MKRFILLFLAIFLTGAKSGIQALKAVPWYGQLHDPLIPLIDDASVLKPGICWAGNSPPPGWGATGTRGYKVENRSKHPISLTLDGEKMAVLGRDNATRLIALPLAAIVTSSRGRWREMFLPAKTICYGVFRYVSPDVYEDDKTFKWKMVGRRLQHGGARGQFIDIGETLLYSVPLFEGTASTSRVYPRGQRPKFIFD